MAGPAAGSRHRARQPGSRHRARVAGDPAQYARGSPDIWAILLDPLYEARYLDLGGLAVCMRLSIQYLYGGTPFLQAPKNGGRNSCGCA